MKSLAWTLSVLLVPLSFRQDGAAHGRNPPLKEGRSSCDLPLPFVIVVPNHIPVRDLLMIRGTLLERFADEGLVFVPSFSALDDTFSSKQEAACIQTIGTIVRPSDDSFGHLSSFLSSSTGNVELRSRIRVVCLEREPGFTALSIMGDTPFESDMWGSFARDAERARLSLEQTRSLLERTLPADRILVIDHCEVFCSRRGISRTDLDQSPRPDGAEMFLVIPSNLLGLLQLAQADQDLTAAWPSTEKSTFGCFALREPWMLARSRVRAQKAIIASWFEHGMPRAPWVAPLNASECGAPPPNQCRRRGKYTKPPSKPVMTGEITLTASHFKLNATNDMAASIQALRLVTEVFAPWIGKSFRNLARHLRIGQNNAHRRTGMATLSALRSAFVPSVSHRRSRDVNWRPAAAAFQRRKTANESSFIGDTTAVSRFCSDHGHNSGVQHEKQGVAICFIGVPRTMSRSDVEQSFLARFVAGLGLNDVRIFAVLSAEAATDKDNVLRSLNSYHAVASAEFFGGEGTESGWCERCEYDHAAMQLKQYSRCMDRVDEYEYARGTAFAFVAKIRPDDLWYGPMVPHCALSQTYALISQSSNDGRWSDQFFILPRALAHTFMRLGHTDIVPHCVEKTRPNATDPIFITSIDSKEKRFEGRLFEALKHHARRQGIAAVGVFFPRILIRADPLVDAAQSDRLQREINVKCANFMPFAPAGDCMRFMLGRDMAK